MKNTINIFKSHIARRCAALAGLVTLMLLFSSAAWAAYYIAGSDNIGLGWGTATLMTNDSYTHVSNSGGSAFFKIYSTTTTTQSAGYYVTGYGNGGKYNLNTLSSNPTLNSGDVTEFEFSVTSGTTYTISITNDVLTVSSGGGGGSEYTVEITSHPHCTADTYSKETSSQSASFSVTADDGWKIISASATSGTASISPVGGGTNVTVTVSSVSDDSEVSIVTEPVSGNTPIVLMGKNTYTNSDCGVVASAYVAYTDCDYAINKFTLYYSNNRAFRTDGSNITKHEDFSGTAGINSTYDDLVIPADKVGEVVKPGSTLYLRVTASNNNSQTSVYSDIVPFKYGCDKFVTNNLEETYTACPGKHQFTWTDMFQSPVPSECTKVELKSGSTYSEVSKASDHFIRQGDQMVWVTEGKASGSYEYRLTAKSGDITGVAEIEIAYSAPGSITGGGELTEISQSASVTTPWTPVTFTATGTKGNLTKIYWTSVPDATLSPAVESLSASSIEAESVFKAPAQNYSQNYTVTATAYTADCASSSVSTTIKVNPDNTDVCPAP